MERIAIVVTLITAGSAEAQATSRHETEAPATWRRLAPAKHGEAEARTVGLAAVPVNVDTMTGEVNAREHEDAAIRAKEKKAKAQSKRSHSTDHAVDAGSRGSLPSSLRPIMKGSVFLHKALLISTSGAVALTTMVAVATAQPALPPKAKADSAKVPAPLFTTKDFVTIGAFAVGTVVMFPFDERLAKHLTNPGAQANKFFAKASTGVEWIASPGPYYIGGTLYVVGRLGHWDRIADLGWHGTESVFLADVVTYVLKGTTGRARPFVSKDTTPHDFKFLKGFGSNDRQSFPSGHATSAFAAAAAVTAETGTWWPRSTWIIGPLMYGGATMVGLSRMYHNKHWASDVVLGAAIGTVGGQKVVQYSHAHPTKIDKVLLHVSAMPDGYGGWALAWNTSW